MELLSPAGNREALEAAIACGADAVYLGYTAFSARSYAGNFDAQQLQNAVEYAHERGKRIYVTVNTLVKDVELQDLCRAFELLARVRADAVLVQDMGAVRVARERFPELTLHASTQMTVINMQGAKLLKELGFTRVVPARECNLDELRRIADTGLEVEAFVHGALCVSVSGQCLFSGMIGGRSGNRGRCAQPCRLPYEASCGAKGYLLCTKDLMLLSRLSALQDVGVCSLKIEGRMKRPEYVGIVTAAYRKALDAMEAGHRYSPDCETMQELEQIFNRGGFTEGYVMGKTHAALMSWDHPGHMGVPVGKVSAVRGRMACVRLSRDLHDGDALQLRGKEETNCVYSGPDGSKGGEIVLRLAHGAYDVRPGDEVYRLTDEKQMQTIRARVSSGGACIPLVAELTAVPGELPKLTLSDADGHTVKTVGSEPVQTAQSQPLTHAYALRQIGKMGGTPYAVAFLTLHGEGAFITAGALNALRRSALELMRGARIAREVPKRTPIMMPCDLRPQEPLLLAQGEELSGAKALLQAGADAFIWRPQQCDAANMTVALEQYSDVKPALYLPANLFTVELSALHALVCAQSERFCAVVANNIGAFALKWPVPVWGGQGLNVTNAQSARFYGALGAQRLTASCEMSYKELCTLMSVGGNYELMVYGRAQLMLLSHCPRRTMAGDRSQDPHCNLCAADNGCPAVYTDRKGYRFPARRIKTEHGCTLALFNSLPTDLARHANKLRALGCSLRLCFTDEQPERQVELVRSYRNVLQGQEPTHRAEETTTGRFMNPVE